MKFTKIKLLDAYIIELNPMEDERGFFARSFCQNEYRKQGIDFFAVQCNISFNKKKGTLRGMHFQENPHEESKVVSCIQGSLFDVIIDLRPESPTYCQWESFELSAQNRKQLFVPRGFAHGFQTLEDNTVVYYQMGEFYQSDASSGVRWDDSHFKINWPIESKIISDRDLSYEDFSK